MIEGKKILVAGFANTGQAVVEFLSHFPCELRVSDNRNAENFSSITAKYPQVSFEFGSNKPESFLWADLIVLSPGIPDTIPPIVAAREKGTEVISEIELAGHYLQGTAIGITGTNGKSTTTELTAAMLQAAGKKAFACGNLGPPLI